jgi:hypothetical protein
MINKAIGFYWTLPVTWLPIEPIDWKDIKQAATFSKTIAMQQRAIHRWARENDYELIHEEAYLEFQPDRVLFDPERHQATSKEDLMKLYRRAEEADACILYVDFSREIGWRHHVLLDRLAGLYQHRFRDVALCYEDLRDFRSHFEKWRRDHKNWLQSKPQRIATALSQARALQADGKVLADIALRLNDQEVFSATGKPWTAESLRKFLKKHS